MNNGSRWWYKEKGRLGRALDDLKVAALLIICIILAALLVAVCVVAYLVIARFLQGAS